MKLIHSSSLNEMCFNLAYDIEEASKKAISDHGRFSLVLSGGNTPLALFKVLVQHFHGRIEWPLVDVFWTDERYVAHTHSDSNYGSAYQKFIKKIPIGNIYPINLTGAPFVDASNYSKVIEKYFTDCESLEDCFDYIILGFGLDGHFSSLFSLCDIYSNESSALVTRNQSGINTTIRISMSYARIIKTRKIVLLAAGTEKREYLNKVVSGLLTDVPVSMLPISISVFYDS